MTVYPATLRYPQGATHISPIPLFSHQVQTGSSNESTLNNKHEEKTSDLKTRVNAGLSALGLYTVGQMIKTVPMEKQFNSSLLSADPRQLTKTILGIFAVKRLNKALGWENPPGWAIATETAVIVHTLMLGFSRKNLGHFALILPLLLSSVGLMNLMQTGAGKWAKHYRPQWDEKQQERLKLGARIFTTVTSIGIGLAIYPKLFMQVSKRSWLKPLVGEKAAQETRDLSYRYLVESHGTPEARKLLQSQVKDGIPPAFKGLPSVEHTIQHHKSVVHSIGNYHDITQAVLDQKVVGNKPIQAKIKEASYRFNLEEVIEFSKTHQTSSEQKRFIQQLLHELKPVEQKLGKGTFEDDYQHFRDIKTIMSNHRDGIKKLDPKWQYLLHCLHHCADHQLGHQPRKIPFFTILGAEGAAMTCTNGCCVGSVWCWADLADLVSSMANTALGKQKTTGKEATSNEVIYKKPPNVLPFASSGSKTKMQTYQA